MMYQLTRLHGVCVQYKYSNIKYSLSNPVVTPVPDESAPVYIVIGDGGNLENAAKTYRHYLEKSCDDVFEMWSGRELTYPGVCAR